MASGSLPMMSVRSFNECDSWKKFCQRLMRPSCCGDDTHRRRGRHWPFSRRRPRPRQIIRGKGASNRRRVYRDSSPPSHPIRMHGRPDSQREPFPTRSPSPTTGSRRKALPEPHSPRRSTNKRGGDPSVKALTQFHQSCTKMAQRPRLTRRSAEAYHNQQAMHESGATCAQKRRRQASSSPVPRSR